MAEIAGLILGTIGISGLFSACIESFDIVVSGKHFSDDYEQLCALVSLSFHAFKEDRLSSCLRGDGEAGSLPKSNISKLFYCPMS